MFLIIRLTNIEISSPDEWRIINPVFVVRLMTYQDHDIFVIRPTMKDPLPLSKSQVEADCALISIQGFLLAWIDRRIVLGPVHLLNKGLPRPNGHMIPIVPSRALGYRATTPIVSVAVVRDAVAVFFTRFKGRQASSGREKCLCFLVLGVSRRVSDVSPMTMGKEERRIFLALPGGSPAPRS